MPDATVLPTRPTWPEIYFHMSIQPLSSPVKPNKTFTYTRLICEGEVLPNISPPPHLTFSVIPPISTTSSTASSPILFGSQNPQETPPAIRIRPLPAMPSRRRRLALVIPFSPRITFTSQRECPGAETPHPAPAIPVRTVPAGGTGAVALLALPALGSVGSGLSSSLVLPTQLLLVIAHPSSSLHIAVFNVCVVIIVAVVIVSVNFIPVLGRRVILVLVIQHPFPSVFFFFLPLAAGTRPLARAVMVVQFREG